MEELERNNASLQAELRMISRVVNYTKENAAIMLGVFEANATEGTNISVPCQILTYFILMLNGNQWSKESIIIVWV